jgi:hypothetical protein
MMTKLKGQFWKKEWFREQVKNIPFATDWMNKLMITFIPQYHRLHDKNL